MIRAGKPAHDLSAEQVAALLAEGERIREQARQEWPRTYRVYRFDRSRQLGAVDPGPDGVYQITTLEERRR